MPSIDSTSAIRYGTEQLRVQQARQTAAQAELTARAMEARAETAKRTAARATEEARSLEVQSSQARTTAGQARQGLAVIESANQARQYIGSTAARTAQVIDAQANTDSTASAVTVALSNSYTANGTTADASGGSVAVTGSLVDTTA